MSVRVNLLPQSTREHARSARQRTVVLVGAVLLIAGLGGIHLWGMSRIDAAEQRLVAATAVTAELQAESAELIEYRDLDLERKEAKATINDALRGEVSLAWVLFDLALVMPDDAQLEAISVDMPRPGLAEESPLVGTFTMTGKTLSDHAPGVERLLHELGQVVSFANLYFNSSSLDTAEGEVATFSVDGELTDWVRTGRYDEGLPEALR